MYSIKYHKSVIGQLKKLNISERGRITNDIHKLRSEILPRDLNIKRFTKTKDSFRLKIGEIRVIYELHKEMKLILVKKIGYRGDIYKY